MMRFLAAKLMQSKFRRTGGAMAAALEAASRDCAGSQQTVLDAIVQRSTATVYGREYGFDAIGTAADFQSRVPMNTYEDLRPYIERHCRGEADVLFPGHPIFYATTSGTTAAPKRIPITAHYHRTCWAGLTDLWLHSMFAENPGFMNGYDLSMVGRAVEGTTEDGTSCGSFSGHLNSLMPGFVKRFRVVPFAAQDIEHYPSKYYVLLRVALGVPIRWIVAPNPSTLLELHRAAVTHLPDIIRDIEAGTLNSNLDIPEGIRSAVEKRLRPDPHRAAELSRLERQHPDLLPRHYWPDLRVINTWTAGNAALYLRQTDGYYPEATAIREFGYLATEARAGIILSNAQRASILAAHMLFFEFIPESETQRKNPRCLLAHELEAGGRYSIVITTPGGLYRYHINDIVRVEGFYNQFPMVTFLYKGTGVTSLTGEKLSEEQFLQAMQDAGAAVGQVPGFHIGFADPQTGGYQIFVELTSPLSDETRERMTLALEASLGRQNPEYRAKRASNRLRPPNIRWIPQGTWQQIKAMALSQGRREGQYKIEHLQQNGELLQQFYSQEKDAAARFLT